MMYHISLAVLGDPSELLVLVVEWTELC